MIELELFAAARAFGWALVHFLWQGALILVLLELALLGLRRSSSDVRYLVRCSALLLMGAAPAVTFQVIRAAQGPLADGAATTASTGTALGLAEAWPLAVVLLWSIGAMLLGARLLRDYLHIRQLARPDSGGALPADWQARFDRLAQSMGVRAVARVVESAKLTAPTVIGALRPVVLLPARLFTGLTQEQIEAVIAHELAHIRRHDFAINLIQSALEAVLFYHPAVWWVSKGIRAEREYCCDDAAVRMAADRVSYARALTTLESWRAAQPAIGMSTLGGSLMHRIQRLLGSRPQRSRVAGSFSILGGLFVASMLAAATLGNAATAQDPDDLRALRGRIASLRARIDELATMADRLVELQGHAGQAHEVPQETHEHGHEHEGDLHEHGLDALHGGLDAEAIHEHVQEALRSVDVERHLHEAQRVMQEHGVDAEKIREQVQQALRRSGIHSRDGNHRIELRGLDDLDLDTIHDRVRQALEKVDVERLHDHPQNIEVDRLHEHLQQLDELKSLDMGKLHEHLMKAREAVEDSPEHRIQRQKTRELPERRHETKVI